ncbi:unnamed protein product [Periconia digitata]|uniref:Uncharacterized protein n=1 Tax=Periconia digitata TaxID=1303443 RepID=A0A9W4XVW9_9PLEO|nr:unnamed protein product [Periconia digitata]
MCTLQPQIAYNLRHKNKKYPKTSTLPVPSITTPTYTLPDLSIHLYTEYSTPNLSNQSKTPLSLETSYKLLLTTHLALLIRFFVAEFHKTKTSFSLPPSLSLSVFLTQKKREIGKKRKLIKYYTPKNSPSPRSVFPNIYMSLGWRQPASPIVPPKIGIASPPSVPA